MLPFLGRAFLLQAMHPTIAAGVADHSSFKEDPFGRLQHSFGLVLDVLYAADGERVGAEVRESHKQIKGVTANGRAYHAYEPEAYFWVLATGYETIVGTADRVMQPLTELERPRAYAELRELGRRFGLRDRDMPATSGEFGDWYRWMLDERIEDNPTARDVVATIRRPAPPAWLPGALWPLPRELAGHATWLTTIGSLPRVARERLGLSWTRLDALQLALVVRALRALDVLPARTLALPPKRDAFARATAASEEPLAAGPTAGPAATANRAAAQEG